MAEVQQLYRQHVNGGMVDIFSSFGFGRVLARRAEGVWIELDDGSRILDFTGGLGVLNHGHNHPRILAARQRFQEQSRMEVHKMFLSRYVAALSHNLSELLPRDLNKVYLCNSGAEAIEGALKLASKVYSGKRQVVLHADNSFHGKLIGSGSISGSLVRRHEFPQMNGARPFMFNDLGSVESAVRQFRNSTGGSDVFAIVVEPFSVTTMQACSDRFLQGVRRICDRDGIALVFDEVYSGCGRTGELFSFMSQDVVPDLLAISKSFGGGKASVSAFISDDAWFDNAYGKNRDALLHTTTYNGFGEECVTALEALAIIVDDDYPSRARQIEADLRPGLERLKSRYPGIIGQIRGKGAAFGIEIRSSLDLVASFIDRLPSFVSADRSLPRKVAVGAILDHMFIEHGVLGAMTENRDQVLLAALPALVTEKDQTSQFLDAMDQTLSIGMNSLVAQFVGGRIRKFLGT